jgi:hypothetical protein
MVARIEAAATGGAGPTSGSPRSLASPVLSWLNLLAVFLCALAVRLPFVLAANFPLGDGGMFAQIVDDIRACGLGLPRFTSYNGGAIPLCYPPLGFYLAALSGLPTIEALRWLPLVLSALVPCSVLLLGRVLLASETGAFAAGLVAGLLPVPYWFGLEGGGLTRSLGLLLMVLAIAALISACEAPSSQRVVLAGIALAASELSHPEASLMTLVLVVAAMLTRPVRARFRISLSILVIALALLLPWTAAVLWRHGLGPWLAALRGGEGLSDLAIALRKIMAWWFTAEPGFPLLGGLALLGVPLALLRRQGFVLVWLLAPVFLVPRNCRFWCAPALALLVGLTLSALVFPGLDRVARSPSIRTLAKTAVLVGIVAYGLVLAQRWNGRVLLLSPVPAEDREALAWLAPLVRPGEQMAAIDCERSGLSGFAEWAPYLAHAESVVVPQGREWVGDGGRFAERAASLREALFNSGRALRAWLHREPGVRWLVVGSRSAGDPRLEQALREAASAGTLRLVYQRSGATVWQTFPTAERR